jgi:hypothetical protein
MFETSPNDGVDLRRVMMWTLRQWDFIIAVSAIGLICLEQDPTRDVDFFGKSRCQN